MALFSPDEGTRGGFKKIILNDKMTLLTFGNISDLFTEKNY